MVRKFLLCAAAVILSLGHVSTCRAAAPPLELTAEEQAFLAAHPVIRLG